jgi:ATP-dependent Clp protease ATP-binding subunit ClpA
MSTSHDPAELLDEINHEVGVGESDALARHCRDLNHLASQGEFEGLALRPEVDALRLALQRKHKGSCVLLGREGVGKTALMEAFVREAVQGNFPEHGQTRFFELIMSTLVAGGKYRGVVEGRLTDVLAGFAELDEEVIVFVDEAHELLDAGAAENVSGIGQSLKAALARGELRLVCATTRAEYRTRILDRDPAFARRFHEVDVDEPRGELLRSMVNAQARKLAKAHDIEIAKPRIDEAIALTDEHVSQRTQPDKAVDLLDLAAATATLAGKQAVTKGELRSALQRWTDRPVAHSVHERLQEVARVETAMRRQIIGQPNAIRAVVDGLQAHAMEAANPRRPPASWLFVGDTGVGKTETAKVLCEALFGSHDRLYRIDLQEYKDANAVGRLIGMSQSHRGSEHQRGALIQPLEAHGQGVLLLDEVEKAHPDVRDLLLGLLDEGRITSGRGRTFDARQWLIVLTSNAITSWQADKPAVGFGTSASQRDVRDKLTDRFPRELLNRFKKIVVFKRLDERALAQICRMRLRELAARLATVGVELQVDDTLVRQVLSKVDSRAWGARDIARTIEAEVLVPLARELSEPELLSA